MKKVLIANRGEIALRIQHSLQSMGIECVSIYTKGEEELPHVQWSLNSFGKQNTICLGEPDSFADTYLNGQKIIQLAIAHQCQGIHPGYGFLSENAAFAQLCMDNGLIFIGPKVENMAQMGDKVASKKTMEELGIPLIPGFHATSLKNISDDDLFEKAKAIGWPVLIKASAGGGGKGMRIVHDPKLFHQDLNLARSEALKSFKNDLVFLEKWLDHPRHIEAQIISDAHGNHYFLGERECSIQRRYQKIIEESPCLFLTKEQRNELKTLALLIAKKIGYLGVGTLEFLFQDGKFYFLEMNTRIQVEHPVTEMVHGLDIVQLQVKVALNEKLDIYLNQEMLEAHGHAIEVRICAEIPERNYMPASGHFINIHVPTLPYCRFDYGYQTNNTLSVYFDPMLAKIIVFGMNRNDAIAKMIYTLKNSSFYGTYTNKNFLLAILDNLEFRKGNTSTHFLKLNEKVLLSVMEEKNSHSEDVALMIAGILWNNETQRKVAKNNGNAHSSCHDIWDLIPTIKSVV